MATVHDLINHAAVLVKSGSPLEVQKRPVPTPGPGQLLLRTHSVAINPSDWMMQQNKTQQQLPLILGSDVAGTVLAVGADASDHSRKGDRVCAFTGGSWSGVLDSGAFQEYVIVSANSATKLPSHVSFDEAATLPMASATAASALWVTLGISRPSSPGETHASRGILINGASSSVGVMAVQMAIRLGFQVFAMASSKHEGYIRSLGAQHFIDRNGSDVSNRLAKAVQEANLKEPLRLAFDAVSSRESLGTVLHCISACFNQEEEQLSETIAQLAITLDWPEDLAKPPEFIQVERTSASHFHVKEENSRWLNHDYLEKALGNGTIKPGPPVRIVEGGLHGLSEALAISKKGLSCEKLIVQL